MNRRQIGIIGLAAVGLGSRLEAQNSEAEPADEWSPDMQAFFETQLPAEATQSGIGEARIGALQKLEKDALPAVALLIATGSDEFLHLLWWRHTVRSVRAAVVAVFLCRRREVKVGEAEEDPGVPYFQQFAGRFRKAEAVERLAEINHVRHNRSLYARKLAEMTNGIERARQENRHYTEVAAAQ